MAGAAQEVWHGPGSGLGKVDKRRKGEVRKPAKCQRYCCCVLSKTQNAQKEIGDIIISKKKFLLSSQKVGISRFEALLGVAGPDK